MIITLTRETALDDFATLATKELHKLSWASDMKIVVRPGGPVWNHHFVLKMRQEAKQTKERGGPPIWIDGDWNSVDRSVINAFHAAVLSTWQKHFQGRGLMDINSEVWCKSDGDQVVIFVPAYVSS